MKKISVLIVQEMIPHYRVPVFNKLQEEFEVTIAAKRFFNKETYQFQILSIDPKQIGSFFYYNTDNIDYDKYDVVMHMFNIRWLNLLLLSIRFWRKCKLVIWGIGVTTERGLDITSKFDKLRYFVARCADAVVFYSRFPLEKYVNKGHLAPQKLFVAHNTLDLKPEYFDTEKNYFLFVGSLIPYKQIEELIEVFSDTLPQLPSSVTLKIVGDGSLLPIIKQIAHEKGTSDRITFLGRIEDEDKLKEIYKHAIASVSPAQAGLSVLQSLAFGVPFITRSNAITGGERFNIIDKQTGLFYNSTEELATIMVELSNNPIEAKRMGRLAYEHYCQHCSLNNMVKGFSDAIYYAFKK